MHKVPHNNYLNINIKKIGADVLSTALLSFCDINLRKKTSKNTEETIEYKFVLYKGFSLLYRGLFS